MTCCTQSAPQHSAVSMSASFCRKNDSLLVGWASRAFFSELLAAGVKIYRLKAGSCMQKASSWTVRVKSGGHGKLDMRSLWLSFEITLVIDDAGFGGDPRRYRRLYLLSAPAGCPAR